ncbi:MAG: hypothetical protein ABI856_20580, partial [Nitrospira sp.]
MTPQDPTLRRGDNGVKDSEVPKYVRKLKRFLGHEALAKAQADLDKDLSHHGDCYRQWAQMLRPWLFAFRLYDQKTNNGICIPKQWPSAIRELVGDARMISALHRGIPENVRAKYRKDLLLVQHNDFMVEIDAAWYYHLEGYNVQWYPLGQDKVPEFRVRGGGLDFYVECRRFGWDLKERVKTPAIADTCDMIYDVILAHGFWGEVRVEFSDNFRFDPGRRSQWSKTLADALIATLTTPQLDPGVQFDPGVKLTLTLEPSPSPKFTLEELVDLTRDKKRSELIFLRSKREGESGFDPVVFRCCRPRKTPEELLDYIYKTLKEKVSTQLSGARAGVAIAHFSGIYDPNVFNDSEGMQNVLRKLFKRRYLAAIILKCHDLTETRETEILLSTPANVFRNPETDFPLVSAAK